MNKEEKLEAVVEIMKELDVSPDEVVTYFQRKGLLLPDTPFHCQAPKKVVPGMFVYADGLISAEIIAGRQIKAVVGYVEGNEVLAVCLQEKELPWSDAVQYCQNYAEDGVKQGEAFLPSITELEKLYGYKDKINMSLKLANSTLLDGSYWSSTEYDDYDARTLAFYSGDRLTNFKYYSNYVRPVLAFSL